MRRVAMDLGAYQGIEKAARERIEQITEAHDAHIAQIYDVKQRLHTATEKYLSEGIAVIPKSLQDDVERLCIAAMPKKVATYFRDLAKELDRPRLIAEEMDIGRWEAGQYHKARFMHLSVPRMNRLKGIVSHLLIVAIEADNERALPFSVPLSRCDTNGMWNFYFNMDYPDGRELFKDLHHRCATDPVFRAILKV